MLGDVKLVDKTHAGCEHALVAIFPLVFAIVLVLIVRPVTTGSTIKDSVVHATG